MISGLLAILVVVCLTYSILFLYYKISFALFLPILDPLLPFKRDLDTVLATSHHSNLTGVTNNTDASTLFSGNTSCVLSTEVTQGPYCKLSSLFCSARDQRLIFLKDVDGEYVRFDIRESQGGVDTYVEIQLIDVSTCNPVSDVYIDFWHGMSVYILQLP